MKIKLNQAKIASKRELKIQIATWTEHFALVKRTGKRHCFCEQTGHFNYVN